MQKRGVHDQITRKEKNGELNRQNGTMKKMNWEHTQQTLSPLSCGSGNEFKGHHEDKHKLVYVYV